ncbi:MAG: starch-binding protein [Muribaculaceae bacterium]|nr:starch-binding protein [Muribaculaceae bacterium]
MKKNLIAVAALWLLTGSFATQAADNGIPTEIQDGNILHCFNWKFTDIKTELPNIAAAGFGAIQVSPVQGNANSGAEWYYAYMPYDFVFKANGNGTRTQLKSLCDEAAKYNIKIIVDVVANHVNGARGYRDSWWDSNGRERYNGGIDYNNRYSITHNQLGDYGDVNSELSEVQTRAKAFVEDLKSLGVKGIRWDAAKHIGLPSESCNFWSVVSSVPGMWHYGEILDGPGGDKYKLLKEYTNYIGVSDTEYSKWTLNQINGGNVPTGSGSWTANGVKGSAVVYWGESHDDYSNDGQYGVNTSQISQDKIDRAYAICACRKNETALYFSRPSATTRNTIKMGVKGSTHFTSKQVAEVNKFRNAMKGTAEYFSASNGVACVTRGGGGAVIVVGAGGSRQVNVSNGGGLVPAGTYKDQVSGNTFTVTNSTISGNVGSTGIAVVYNPDGVIDPIDPIDPDDPDDPTDGITVYYDNGATNYGSVYVYYWGGSETAPWPGKPMTLVAGNIYKYTLPTGTTGAVFNNNNQGKQTEDVDNPVHNHLYKGQNQNAKTPCTDLGVYNENGNNDDPDPIPDDVPAALYVLGNIKGASWSTSNGVKMSRDGSKYEAKVEFVAASGESKCYFNLTDALAPTWDQLNAIASRYGAASEGMALTLGNKAAMVKYANGVDASNCKSWTIPAGVYYVTADFSDMTISYNTTSGMEEDFVDAEDAEPVYYNLQGIRVDNPSNGLYIVVRGSKVSKEMIR